MDGEANRTFATVDLHPTRLAVNSRVNVSMLSLKWGDVLSTLLPGAVALFAVAPYFPLLWSYILDLNKAGLATGMMLLIASAMAGGVLEAITRILWEPYWLMRRCKPPDSLSNLNPDNLELYERGVQSSYKYVTFYANFAWATALLLANHLYRSTNKVSVGSAILIISIVVLLCASDRQWKYYVNYQKKIFDRSKLC
jgi:hypothetical protein